jgi:hypothetical protein
VVRGKDGRPLYSWRVLLLPSLEEPGLYDQFKLDEPWDSPHNLPLVDKMPRCYAPWGGYPGDETDKTHYQVLVGPGTAFERDGLSWDDFPDGLENTLLVVEATKPVPWTKPVDLVYDPARPLPVLGGLFQKHIDFLCYEIGTKPGFNAVFADGKSRFIRADNNPEVIRALITRNGGEKVDPSVVK